MKILAKSILICGALAFASFPVLANDVAVNKVEASVVSDVESSDMEGADVPALCSFDRSYTTKINSQDYTEVMSDTNVFGDDDTVRIWQQGDGKPGDDTEIIYKVKAGSEISYYYLTEGQMAKFQIDGGQSFTIWARYADTTTSGTITTDVTLDDR